MATKQEKRQTRVTKALDKAFKSPSGRVQKELSKLRLILFSDLHRGVRDGADDFQRCERAYNAALAYYFNDQYTLCLLGDVEELWECRPGPVIEKYRDSFALERRYHDANRYWRIWGNHDDLWSFPDAVRKYLGPVGLGGNVWESLRVEVMDGDTPLGELFLIHGHQGTLASDVLGQWSRLLVRYVWRNWQRLTHMASTTPARDWELRRTHDTAMYEWALDKRATGLILVAGHTHRPVFRAQSKVDALTRELARLAGLADGPDLLEWRRRLEAELEWVKASQFQTPPAITMEAPCYFNTGCGSFGDGDVTALQIADGKIQLVRWPNDKDEPLPQALSEAVDLRQCFEEVRGIRRPPEREGILSQPGSLLGDAPFH